MYCPYCKGLMKLKNEEFYCECGNCYFSKNLSSYFIKATKSDVRRPVGIFYGYTSKMNHAVMNINYRVSVIDFC